MTKVLTLLTKDFTDWEKFQSLLDSLQELYELKWLVATPKFHKFIGLYSKIDLLPCTINSIMEHDKYDLVFVAGKSRLSISKEFFTLYGLKKPAVAYYEDEDEFEWFHSREATL